MHANAVGYREFVLMTTSDQSGRLLGRKNGAEFHIMPLVRGADLGFPQLFVWALGPHRCYVKMAVKCIVAIV